MEIVVVDERDMGAELDREIKAGLCVCFPADAGVFAVTRAWHGSGPAYSVLAREGGKIVGHVGVVVRTIRVGGTAGAGGESGLGGEGVEGGRGLGGMGGTGVGGGRAVRMAGVQNVFVLPERRGTGVVDRTMAEAMAEAARRGLDIGLLFCLEKVVRTYARCGWKVAPGRVIWATKVSGERYRLPEKNILMEYGLGMEELPAGELDLCGDDW